MILMISTSLKCCGLVVSLDNHYQTVFESLECVSVPMQREYEKYVSKMEHIIKKESVGKTVGQMSQRQ
jgi:hypothetical protein